MNSFNLKNPFFLIITIITFFVFVVSFTAFYTTENFSSACGCTLPPWIIIIAVASFGLCIGSLVFFLLNKNFLSQKKSMKSSTNKLLQFFDDEERAVLSFLSKNSSPVFQSSLSKDLAIDKVKLSRILNSFEKKQLIKKEPKGMTNLISLDDDLKSWFSS
jgi:hypothetical protein